MPHIHEKVDFTVEVFIVNKNKVLLRMHDKHNIWLSVGGHIELDEDPIMAAIREVKEEGGLDINIVGEAPTFPEEDYTYLIAPKYVGKHKVNDTHEHVVFVYFAKSDTDAISDSILEHEKGAEIKWVTKEELEAMDLRPNVRHLAKKALEELGE